MILKEKKERMPIQHVQLEQYRQRTVPGIRLVSLDMTSSWRMISVDCVAVGVVDVVVRSRIDSYPYYFFCDINK